MSPKNFCYWLNGWIELNKTIDHRGGASVETLKVIEDHLKLVFKKETPDRNEDKDILDKKSDILNIPNTLGVDAYQKYLDALKKIQETSPPKIYGPIVEPFRNPNEPAPVTGPIAITC